MKQKRRIKTILTILVVLLIINIFSVTKVCLYNVLANNNTTTASNTNSTNSKTKETSIELFSGKASDNIPYDVDNMYPGDGLNDNSYTNYYNIKVNYHSNITVHFNVDITSDENIYLADDRPEEDIDTDQDNTDDEDNHKLSEVLKIKINVLNLDNNKSKTLYDGLMKDISDDDSSITYDLSSSTSTSSKFRYEIIVYLDTSVNNDYQHKALTADFNWWVEDRKNLEPSDNILWKVVDTGVGIDYIANNTSTYLMINIFLLVLSLSLIIYLRSILYKEDIR